MPKPDIATIAALTGKAEWPRVSIYLPTHLAGAGTDEDKLRLKNLISAARDDLVAQGMRGPDADGVLAPASGLLTEDLFWRSVTPGGTALFLSADGMRTVAVDTPVPEQWVVGDRFFLRPLFAAHGSEMRFFALAIGKGGWRLYSADRASIEPLEAKGAPVSLADETKYDVEQDDLQSTTFASPESVAGAGRGTAMFHGHGGEKDVETRSLANYLRHVEEAVTAALGRENTVPLVLLGVDYELARYREINTYPALSARQVAGAVDELSPYEIHRRALEALDPEFEQALEEELRNVHEHEGSPLVSHDPAEIVEAAASGRVKALFFDDSAGPFGLFDPDRFTVTHRCVSAPRLLRETEPPLGTVPAECGWDLIDLAAAETVLHGGEVHAFSGDDAPVHGAVALLRY